MRNFLWCMVTLAGVAEIVEGVEMGGPKLLVAALLLEFLHWLFNLTDN